MAKTRKIRLSSKVSVSFDAFWNVFPSKEMLYLLPSLCIRTFSKSVTFGLPLFILQFNWLYILATINVFIEGEIVMFGFIKRWMERRRRKSILKDIKKAKQFYVNGRERFMCKCFFRVDCIKYTYYPLIRQRIPEFIPETFGISQGDIPFYWWPTSDRESRIKAFDKLIEIYSK